MRFLNHLSILLCVPLVLVVMASSYTLFGAPHAAGDVTTDERSAPVLAALPAVGSLPPPRLSEVQVGSGKGALQTWKVQLGSETPTFTPTITRTPTATATAIGTVLPPYVYIPSFPATPTPTGSATAVVTRTVSPPYVYIPSFPGQMTLDAVWDESGLYLRANADYIATGGEVNVGIDHVDLIIQDLNGNVIATKTEYHAPYCFFSEENNDCKTVQPGTAEFEWSPGNPIEPGDYLVRGVAYTPDKRLQMAEQFVHISIPADTLQTLFVDIDSLTGTVSDELGYEVEVGGAALDPSTGDAVDHLELSVIDYTGAKVSTQTSVGPNYCGFRVNSQDGSCNVYNFAANNFRWPNGYPMYPTQYLLRAIAFTRSGKVEATSGVVTLEGVPAPSTVPSGNSGGGATAPSTGPSGNSALSNVKILADGQNDVSEVHGALVFRTLGGENGIDGNNVDRVEMSILDGSGQVVHTRTESSPKYCAYGGDAECNRFVFADENFVWDNGESILDGETYTFRATVYFRSGSAPVTVSRPVTVHYN